MKHTSGTLKPSTCGACNTRGSQRGARIGSAGNKKPPAPNKKRLIYFRWKCHSCRHPTGRHVSVEVDRTVSMCELTAWRLNSARLVVRKKWRLRLPVKRVHARHGPYACAGGCATLETSYAASRPAKTVSLRRGDRSGRAHSHCA